VELHAVHERVVIYRPGVCSASTKTLEIGLSGPCEIVFGDRGERQQFDVVDLDRH
jgi:hypothetical protein